MKLCKVKKHSKLELFNFIHYDKYLIKNTNKKVIQSVRSII